MHFYPVSPGDSGEGLPYAPEDWPNPVIDHEFASSLVEAELLGADSQLSHTCKAGNNMCISLSVVSDPPLSEAMFCDICCSEPDFCRNCCCILCSKTICLAFGSYNYIRCKAISLDGCICGHIAHLDCALRAHMVGTVGGSYDLDAEYFCRRCDSRTDLVSNIMELLQICESIDSREEIEMVLNSAISILQGSKKLNARQLLHRIESVMAKV
nr:protein OBERON 1-like isoform X2 [Ipomoea batatas]